MGSPRFRHAEAGGVKLTDIWFPPHTVIPYHAHSRPVMGVMLEGGFEDLFRGRTLTPGAGEIFTEPGGEGHSNRVGGRGARVLVLQPDPTDVELWESLRGLLDEIGSRHHAGVVGSAWRLTHEMRTPDAVSRLAMESLALDMLVTAVRSGTRRVEPAWLTRVDQMIREGFRTALRVEDLAAEAGVHRGQLARAYREHRGVPPSTHIRDLRLTWAAERLATGDMPISSVAIQAGFSDQSHLTRAFKRRFGAPPAAYRRLFREGGAASGRCVDA